MIDCGLLMANSVFRQSSSTSRPTRRRETHPWRHYLRSNSIHLRVFVLGLVGADKLECV